MATAFPTSPTDYQVFSKGGQQYVYTASTNTWNTVSATYDNSGSIGVPLFGAYDIREDLFGEWNNGAGTITDYGGTALSDTTTYATAKWNGDNIMKWDAATSVTTGPGLAITVPAGYDMVWIRMHGANENRETLWEYAWNATNNVIGTVRNYGYQSAVFKLGPSGTFSHKQYNPIRNQWAFPMYLPDRLGGTLYVASLNTTTTRDNWFGGFAFSRNDRHLTMQNPITGWRGDYGGTIAGTLTGSYYGAVHVAKSGVVTNPYTQIQRFGMPVINSTGRDKILVVTHTREADGTYAMIRPWLRITDEAGNSAVVLTQNQTSGVDMNFVAESTNATTFRGGSTLSFRIPATALNQVTNISDDLQIVQFQFLHGESFSPQFYYSHAYCYDA